MIQLFEPPEYGATTAARSSLQNSPAAHSAVFTMKRQSTKNSSTLLFFSRGRGRGHAIPDDAIAKALRKRIPHLKVQFVSYSTGAATLRELGNDVTDLEYPEHNPFLPTLISASDVIQQFKPGLVVSHEEFCVPIAASIAMIPNVFMTDWFLGEKNPWMRSLIHADAVICIDDEGHFEIPSYLAGNVAYTGPVIRQLTCDRTQRPAMRREFGLPEQQLAVVVIPGGALNSLERTTPTAKLILSAFELLKKTDKSLLWVAGDDFEYLSNLTDGYENIRILPFQPEIERLIVASDIIITKGTRLTSLEASALGVPTISISYRTNPIDDRRTRAIPNHQRLNGRGLTSDELAKTIEQQLAAPAAPQSASLENGLTTAVDLLYGHIQSSLLSEARTR